MNNVALENIWIYEEMCKKLSPRRIASSDKMRFIISLIVGENWVTHPDASGGFSITSDGFVMSGSLLVAQVSEFERNINGYLEVAELDEQEMSLFKKLYACAVQDWRNFGQPGVLK